MNQKINLYDGLGIVAMIATPLAAAIIFGWNLYTYLLAAAVPVYLAIFGAVAGAIAMESVGIYAGHVAIDYTRRRDWRALIAAAALAFYIGFGWSKVPTYGAVFILAGFMYALVALRHEAVAVDEEMAASSKSDKDWQHRLEIERLRMKHEEKLARIDATKATKAQPVTQPAQPDNATTQFTPAQMRVLEVARRNPEATQQQLADELGITRQAVGKHLSALNGYVREGK